jgi:hypothetical protein
MQIQIQISSYSHQKNEKKQTFLLKGLNNNFTEKEILTELINLQTKDLKFTKVTRFETPRSIKNKIKLPICIIQLTPESKLSTINIIHYHKVSWERIIIKKKKTQCYNCQYLGHTAQNYNLIYKCVKCNEQHNPRECKIEKEKKSIIQKFFATTVRMLDSRHHIRDVQNSSK